MPIGINIEKSKEIHKNTIRTVRDLLLKKADVDYMKALESGNSDKIAEVVEIKQSLRDAPTIVDEVEISAGSVLEVTKELKQVWNDELLGPNPLLKQ